MEKEIQEIIEKNLPAQVGTVLKQTLQKAEEDAETVISQKERLDAKDREINKLNNTISEYRKYDEQWQALNKREEDISTRERNAKVAEAELKAVEADKRATEIAGIVQMVFKSPVYRKNYLNNLFYGNNGTTGGIPQEVTESEE